MYFFLGNSYDNAYKPARAGEASNDSYIQKAIENYRKAAEHDKNPRDEEARAAVSDRRLRARQTERPEPGGADRPEAHIRRTRTIRELLRALEDLRGFGPYDEAEAALMKAREVKPDDPSVYTTISGFYNRQGQFDKTMEALHKAAELKPNDPQGHQLVAVYYFDKSNKDHRADQRAETGIRREGHRSADRALALNPDYSDALTYKNLLLRILANTETDRAKQQDYLREADQLRSKAIELNKKKTAGTVESESISCSTSQFRQCTSALHRLRIGRVDPLMITDC